MEEKLSFEGNLAMGGIVRYKSRGTRDSQPLVINLAGRYKNKTNRDGRDKE